MTTVIPGKALPVAHQDLLSSNKSNKAVEKSKEAERRPVGILDLPNELLKHIFGSLNHRDTARARGVCKRLYSVIDKYNLVSINANIFPKGYLCWSDPSEKIPIPRFSPGFHVDARLLPITPFYEMEFQNSFTIQYDTTSLRSISARNASQAHHAVRQASLAHRITKFTLKEAFISSEAFSILGDSDVFANVRECLISNLRITDTDFLNVTKKMTKVRDLYLASSNYQPGTFRFTHLKELESLKIKIPTGIGAEQLAEICKIRTLEVLELSRTWVSSPSEYMVLNNLPLKALTMNCETSFIHALEDLKLKNLTRLSLDKCCKTYMGAECADETIQQQFATFFKNHPQIAHLNLSNFNLTSEFVGALPENLVSLSINNCKTDVRILTELRNNKFSCLKEFSAFSLNVTNDAFIEVFKDCTEVKIEGHYLKTNKTLKERQAPEHIKLTLEF